MRSRRRLYRNPERRWIGGVCAGIADYLAVPVFWVRLLALLPMLSPLLPLVALGYFIMVLRIPVQPDGLYQNTEQEEFLRTVHSAPSATFGEVRHRLRDIEHRIRRMEAYVTSADFRFREIGAERPAKIRQV